MGDPEVAVSLETLTRCGDLSELTSCVLLEIDRQLAAAPRQNVPFPRQNSPFPWQNAHFPQQKIHFPQQKVHFPRQNSHFPLQNALFPRQNPPFPLQNAHFPQQRFAGPVSWRKSFGGFLCNTLCFLRLLSPLPPPHQRKCLNAEAIPAQQNLICSYS